MGIKIKKDTKPRLEDLPMLKIRYTLAIPLIGIVDILTMGSFYANPVTDGHIMLKIFYVINALIGGTFLTGGSDGRPRWTGKRSVSARPSVPQRSCRLRRSKKRCFIRKRKMVR